MIIAVAALGLLLMTAIASVVICLVPTTGFEWREMLLPEDLTDRQVDGLLRHIAALREGPICLRALSAQGRLRFFIGGPAGALTAIAGATSGLIPELRLEALSKPDEVSNHLQHPSAASVSWAGPWPLLRTDAAEQTGSPLLGILSAAGQSDQALLEVRLWPAGRVNRPIAAEGRQAAAPNPWLLRWLLPAQPPREDLRVIRDKYSDLLLRSEVLVAAESDSHVAASAAVHRLIVGLRSAGARRGVARYRMLDGAAAIRLLERRRPPLPWEPSTLLSPNELSGICGLPIGAPAIAGISYGVAPRLMPPLDLPTKGRILARSNWPAARQRALAQPIIGALQHTVLVGPTGSGKSTAIINLVRQDLEAGRGALVLDLKGDLVSDLLAQIPSDRRGDVIVLEPASDRLQPGLQLFGSGGVDAELTSDLILGTLRELFSDSWGIRSSQYLGLGLKTLAASPGSSLVELPLLFSDANFRSAALRRISDPWLLAAWQRFLALSAADRAAQLSSPLTKLEELTGRGRLRQVLGQRESRLNFKSVLAGSQVVLVSLPPGLLGSPATRLLAALTLWQFFQAVEGRAGVSSSDRKPFMAYVDEVGVLSDLPLPIDSMLERARGHGVGLTLSPQALSQLSPEVQRSLLANAGSLISFAQTSAKEADLLARNLPGLRGSQLQHLGRYEIAMRLSLGPGALTSVMTGQAAPPPEPVSRPDEIRALAAKQWGRSLAEVDADLGRTETGPLDGPGDSETPLGVTRRRS